MKHSSFLNSVPFEEIEIGMEATFGKKVENGDIELFAKVSGDVNPIHLDDKYAEKSRFKKRIAHGLMSASYFSALFGTKIPGQGCVYVSQSLKFKRPVFLGDYVEARIVVTDKDQKKRRVFFKTVCTVNNKMVIDGDAELFVP